MPPTRFQQAVEARDSDAVRTALANDVVFHAPLQHRPFHGRDTVSLVLAIPAQVFAFTDTFRYTRTLSDGDWHALFFTAQLPNGRDFDGVDLLHLNSDGLVDELRIMMRPIGQLNEFEGYARSIIDELPLDI